MNETVKYILVVPTIFVAIFILLGALIIIVIALQWAVYFAIEVLIWVIDKIPRAPSPGR